VTYNNFFRVTGGYLKGLLEGFPELVSDFIEATEKTSFIISSATRQPNFFAKTISANTKSTNFIFNKNIHLVTLSLYKV
jgi:hypothetical protein